jgi:MraZ protein
MFTGEHPLMVDDKGRVAVPAKFRQVLTELWGPQLYVVPLRQSKAPAHIEVYPAERFKEITRQIEELADNELAEVLNQEFIGRATPVDLDGQGRILVPQKFREEVGLNGRALIVGRNKRFELWNEDVYNSTRADADTLTRALGLITRR